jgi:hypothetical protein
MRKKKTVTQTRNHRKTSSRKQSGLTARSTNAQQSARPRSALDNRSHRTVMRFSCASPQRGGQSNKGSEHVVSILEEHAAQHGQRPYAEWQQRQLQTLVRLKAARSIHDGPRRQEPTALRQLRDRRMSPGGAVLHASRSLFESGYLVTRPPNLPGRIRRRNWLNVTTCASSRPPSVPTPAKSACSLTVMRFSCAPPERGGQQNKGSENMLSIVNEPAAQHGLQAARR